MIDKGNPVNSSKEESESPAAQTEKIKPLPDSPVKIVNLNDIAAEEARTSRAEKTVEPSEIPFMRDPLDGQREVPPHIQPQIENQTEEDLPDNLLIPSPSTAQSFPALPDNGTTTPPDTHGAAGPNHVMTVLNTQVRVQNKTGAIISTVSLNGFWASAAPSGGVFDPKILYDPYGSRWIFTACVDRRSANSGVLLGVSQTSDPTGNWFLYRAVADSSGVDWADYPSMGFNTDWIVVSVTMFKNVGDVNNGTRTFVFRKNSLYGGTYDAGVFIRSGSEGFTITPAITYSNTEPTLYLLSNWNSVSGFLRLYTVTGSVGSEVYTVTQIFPQAVGLSGQSGAPSNFAPQLNGSVGIDNNDGRLQNVVFRNGSLWATHTIFTPASGTPINSAVQWWQINPNDGGVAQVGRIQEANRFFAFPSIAVNQNNDVLVGYSSFAANQFAAASYSFRAATDPSGTMRDDATLKAGEGCYHKTFSGTRNRWGDYSSTVVDPSDNTSFWTIQEYAAQSVPAGVCTNGSGRWGTWWGKIIPPAAPMPGETAYAGTGVGAIPDGLAGTPPQFGSPLTVSFAVSGVTGPITDISLEITMTHTRVGDLEIILRSPGGTASHTIVNRIGATAAGQIGDSSNYDGTYTFRDAAPGNIWTTATAAVCGDTCVVAPGSYRTTGAGSETPTNFTAAFAGLTPEQRNGTWTLTFRDSGANDTGVVTAARLKIQPTTLPNNQIKFDFDGDRKSDVAVFRPSNGVWYLQQSTAGFTGVGFGQNGDLIAPADYDGDGKTDVAVFRPSNGVWYLQQSTVGFTGIAFGASGDIPAPADYDNDGKADLAVFRPSNGVWYIQQSTAGFVGVAFGANGDVPVAADYDGDGRADIAVFRPSNGVWYLQRSQLGFIGIAFGVSGDKPVPADYDGDSKADIAVFRPSNGVWYLQQSTAGFTGIAFGANGDLPVAADYDGDGKSDVAVFRPSNGVWYLQRSTQGFTGVAFGASGDKPAPNAFVP